jgi:hypothetical protein
VPIFDQPVSPCFLITSDLTDLLAAAVTELLIFAPDKIDGGRGATLARAKVQGNGAEP